VLVETILAAFEMEEILYELRQHASGLNAGRWDYIFSIIKKFNKDPHLLFPDRSEITMTVPFMRAYTELLVRTCHKRKAHAMGGMAAFIPSRKDKAVNEIAMKKVAEDKIRESKDGFDGTWVAHPDLVPIAMQEFNNHLQDKPHQKHRLREEVRVSAKELLNFSIPDGHITEAGIRQNINVSLQYLDSWLRGTGAAAIFNLMEDAATAEISRAQLWQWLHRKQAHLPDGKPIDEALYRKMMQEEAQKVKETLGSSKLKEAAGLIDRLVLDREFIDFLTIPAYDLLS
jgi:malate synthase